MHVLLMPVGSHGDVLPLLGLGRRLKARGHTVQALLNPVFRTAAASAEVDMLELGCEDDYHRVQNDPDISHPQRGLRAVSRVLGEHMESGYEAVREALCQAPKNTVLVGTTLAFALRCVGEVTGHRVVTIHLSPSVIRSTLEPPVLLPQGPLPDWLPRSWVDLFWWLTDRLMADPYLAKPLNRLRKKLGLTPVRRLLGPWLQQSDLTLALFPDWFAHPADWPTDLKLTGFPLWDIDEHAHLSQEVEDFLNEGEPPLVFTGGTGFARLREFYDCCLKVCSQSGMRGLLLTRHSGNVPSPLPANVRHLHYAPLSLLLPRVSALVHHGGIGTMAQALAAGIPQVVLPQAHDQFDNAYRLQRLGLGRWCRAQNPAALGQSLSQVLSDADCRVRCQKQSHRVHSGLDQACGHIESLSPR